MNFRPLGRQTALRRMLYPKQIHYGGAKLAALRRSAARYRPRHGKRLSPQRKPAASMRIVCSTRSGVCSRGSALRPYCHATTVTLTGNLARGGMGVKVSVVPRPRRDRLAHSRKQGCQITLAHSAAAAAKRAAKRRHRLAVVREPTEYNAIKL